MSEKLKKWWVGLAWAVAVFELAAGAQVAVLASDGSTGGRIGWSSVMIAGGALLLWGLRSRLVEPRRGAALIALGALPALLWFWYVVPAVAALGVLVGAVLELRRDPVRDHALPHQ